MRVYISTVFFGLLGCRLIHLCRGDENSLTLINFYSAFVNITYRDPATGEVRSEEDERGWYGSESRIDSEWGWVVHVRTADNKTDGCRPPVNAPSERWIALVERGSCKFHQKIYNAAILLNASAVVVYNNENDEQMLSMKHKVEDVVSIFINRHLGLRIASLVDNGTRILMHISVGLVQHSVQNPSNRTSVVFVAVSFVVLMSISLLWLIFYYVQRFRYTHTKDRLSKRLMNAAKKAVARLDQKIIRRGDRELDQDFDLCAICVEEYKVCETIRILPCKHVYHKSCVDPWLLEHRNCPICKLDILQACGIHLNHSKETVSSNVSTTADLETPFFFIEASEFLLNNSAYPSTSNDQVYNCTSPARSDNATCSLITVIPHDDDLDDD